MRREHTQSKAARRGPGRRFWFRDGVSQHLGHAEARLAEQDAHIKRTISGMSFGSVLVAISAIAARALGRRKSHVA